MRKEFEDKLVNRWPGWFDLDGDPYLTCMPRGFEHGDGWFDLIWRLCEQIVEVLDDGEQPLKVLQVKDKFGGLRFLVEGGNNDAIRPLIEAAEEQSFQTCEMCGQSGKLRHRGRSQTLCNQHA